MPAVLPAPIAMQTALLLIGTDNYEAAVSAAELVPTTPSLAFKGIGGQVVNVVGAPSWVLNLTFAQDPVTAKSLTNYLNANIGLPKVAKLTPTAGGPSWTVTFVPVAVNIGGAVDAIATSAPSMPVNGQPVLAAA